jgi:two-component system, cell cycle response regulator DivK
MSKCILVVEDQPNNRQIIRDMLAPTDYEITEAENGEEALAAVARQRPDLILMGVQLPSLGGYEVTCQIKADPALQSIPIIAVTSHALNGEEQTARAAGCDDRSLTARANYWRKFSSACHNKCYRLLHRIMSAWRAPNWSRYGTKGHRHSANVCFRR